MTRRTKICTGLIVVALLATAGCSRWLDRFRPKHPDPPAGLFPAQVGRMALEEKDDKNPNCTRANPLHCWANYVEPGSDNASTRIDYFIQFYDSPDEANKQLETYHDGLMTEDEEENSWEDRLNKQGQKTGRVLIKNTVRRENDQILGYCSASYTKEAMYITITHGYECQPVRQFLKDLTALVD